MSYFLIVKKLLKILISKDILQLDIQKCYLLNGYIITCKLIVYLRKNQSIYDISKY